MTHAAPVACKTSTTHTHLQVFDKVPCKTPSSKRRVHTLGAEVVELFEVRIHHDLLLICVLERLDAWQGPVAACGRVHAARQPERRAGRQRQEAAGHAAAGRGGGIGACMPKVYRRGECVDVPSLYRARDIVYRHRQGAPACHDVLGYRGCKSHLGTSPRMMLSRIVSAMSSALWPVAILSARSSTPPRSSAWRLQEFRVQDRRQGGPKTLQSGGQCQLGTTSSRTL